MKSLMRAITVISLFSINSISALAVELSDEAYSEQGKTKGTILLAANWGRQWKCGEYENAQLVKLGFTNLSNDKDKSSEQLILETPSKLLVKPEFLNYGFLVEPGTYAITEFSVKVAKSVSDVGYISADANKLLVNNEPKGGTFNIEAGEVVYIGHFFLDCYKEPIPWRYYPEGKEAFNSYVKSIKNEYPYLEKADIRFRILNTTIFGNPYELQ